MRKKLKMRSGGAVKKYQAGGRVSQGLRSAGANKARDAETDAATENDGMRRTGAGRKNMPMNMTGEPIGRRLSIPEDTANYKRGGKVAKYAEGGRVGGQRPTEDRAAMAAEAAAGFDAEEDRIMQRRPARARPPQDNPWARGESILTNRPVGAAPRVAATPARMPSATDMAADGPAAGSMASERPLPTPPRPPRRVPSGRAVARGRPTRSREMSADDLNDREMTRILNERSLAAAQAGRNMYRKGGPVSSKGKK